MRTVHLRKSFVLYTTELPGVALLKTQNILNLFEISEISRQ